MVDHDLQKRGYRTVCILFSRGSCPATMSNIGGTLEDQLPVGRSVLEWKTRARIHV